jgi:hypothetical protein
VIVIAGVLGGTVGAAALYVVASAARVSFPRGLAGTRDFLRLRLGAPPVARAAWIGVLAAGVGLGLRAAAWSVDGVRIAQSHFTPDAAQVEIASASQIVADLASPLVFGAFLLLGYSALRGLIRRRRLSLVAMIAMLSLFDATGTISRVGLEFGWVSVAVLASVGAAMIVVWALESGGWLAVTMALALVRLFPR